MGSAAVSHTGKVGRIELATRIAAVRGSSGLEMGTRWCDSKWQQELIAASLQEQQMAVVWCEIVEMWFMIDQQQRCADLGSDDGVVVPTGQGLGKGR
ncbi:hypothetical protein C1H46_011732 [Malus baccata]|uniref:Uncharacterized protein n=1 Tax=Malus baccata TaxID=106549 RepID=A0A540MWM7_MALBA|nr:hypothetical protein C1H46_011732 [Malus baccata]